MKITIATSSRLRFHIESPQTAGLGGIETACIELSVALAARGHAVTLVSRTDRTRERAGVVNVGLEALGDISGDVVIAASDAQLLRPSRHAGYVFWLHNLMTIRKAVRRGQLGPMLQRRPHAVLGGPFALGTCSKLYPFASRRILPLGISAEFLTSRLDRQREPRFVYASIAERGFGVAVRAWQAARPRMNEEATLHAFGVNASHLGMTEDEARKAGIILHSRQTKAELASFYETATAMLYPNTVPETFCLAAAEAQCAGLPVITLGVGALAERVQHGVNGLICQDISQLSDALVALSRDKELSAQLREGALCARTTMSWARVAKLWESWLQTLLPHLAGTHLPSSPRST